MKVIEYLGKRFASMKGLYRQHAAEGVTYACFVNRLKNGWDIGKALHEPQSKNTRRTFEIDGHFFESLKALATAAEISYDAAVKRCHRGFSDREIFYGKEKAEEDATKETSEIAIARGNPVAVNGCNYKNLYCAYEALKPKASFNSVRARIRYGWSLEQALEVEQKIDGRKIRADVLQLTIRGEVLNAMQASRRFQVPYSTVIDRLMRGAAPEQAVGLASIKDGDLVPQRVAYQKRKRKIQKKVYKVDGIEFYSVAELANAYNLSSKLVYNRMRINGWTAEKAVKEPITEGVEVDGVKYRSAMAAWEEMGQTSFFVYTSRKNQGLPLAVCLGLAPLPAIDRYEFQGKAFSSLAEVAEVYNLTIGQLNSRLQSMTLEEAIAYVPSNGRYTLKRFKDEPALARTIGCLYFVKLESSDGILHKIGITQRTVSSRFQSQSYDLIAEFKGELKKLFMVEQRILKDFRANHYRGDDDFDGRTETFLLLDDEEAEMRHQIELLMVEYGIAKDG